MENKETQENIIPKPELLHTINEVKFENYEIFKFLGFNYCLLLYPEEDKGEEGNGWFSDRSSLVDGADIYILETLSLEEKRRTLFHELIEAILTKNNDPQAHEKALAEEEKQFGKRK